MYDQTDLLFCTVGLAEGSLGVMYTLVSPNVKLHLLSSALAHSLRASATMSITMDKMLPMIDTKWRSREGLS